MAPLARHDEISTEWRGEADALVKPNDRLTPLERLEIYSRSYWFRVIDCLYDDFPGLAAALGPRAFDKMARAYLAAPAVAIVHACAIWAKGLRSGCGRIPNMPVSISIWRST